MHAHLIDKRHRLFAPVLVLTSYQSMALSSGGAAVPALPLGVWPVSTCIHYCHSNFSLKAEVTDLQFHQRQTGDMDSEKLAWWDTTGLGGANNYDCPLPTPSKWGSFNRFLPDHCHVQSDSALPKLPSFLGKPGDWYYYIWNFLSFQQGNKIFRAPIFKFAAHGTAWLFSW